MSLSETEYAVLRQTIAARGTARAMLLPMTIIGWGVLTLAILAFSAPPIASLIGLAVIAAGFEAIHALHVGVERIGRYLQVYYEAGNDTPRWETTAMAVGPSLPGGGTDPLFSVLFVCVALINLSIAVLARPLHPEFVIVALLHLALIFRIYRSRGAAARQRAVELESYRALRVREGDRQ